MINADSYVVIGPLRNEEGERVLFGGLILAGLNLSRRAAGQLSKAISKADSRYYGKTRTAMFKTAQKAGLV